MKKKKSLESKIATLTTSLSTVQSRIAALEKQLRPLKARQQSLIDHINSINEQLDFLPRSKVLHFFRSSAHASEQVNQRCLPFLQDGQWSKPTKWDNKIAQVMRNVFGIFGGFRHHQKEAINAAMSGADVRLHLILYPRKKSQYDCSQVFLVKPTGGGKSLCFQVHVYLLMPSTVLPHPPSPYHCRHHQLTNNNNDDNNNKYNNNNNNNNK